MSVLCSVSERIHSSLPEEAHVTLLKTKIHLINFFLNQARPIFLKSSYMICTCNWPFMEEQKSTGKGAEWGAIIVLSRLLYFHNRWRPKSKLNFN